MRGYCVVLTLFVAFFMANSVQPTFAQRTSRLGKRGKIIDYPKYPPKRLSIEVTVNGGGTYPCLNGGATCTWSVDRKYAGTLVLDEFREMPYVPNDFRPGTAAAVAQTKAAATAGRNTTTSHNSKWFTNSNQEASFDVAVTINDHYEVSWVYKSVKENKEQSEVRTITDSWTADNVGKGVRYGEVILDRQNQLVRILYALGSDARMIYRRTRSWEEINELPKERPVFPIPTIENYLQGQIVFPLAGNWSSDRSASFEKTFSGLKANTPCFGELPAEQFCTIGVTYKFGDG